MEDMLKEIHKMFMKNEIQMKSRKQYAYCLETASKGLRRM
jgi:hypothetical protein